MPHKYTKEVLAKAVIECKNYSDLARTVTGKKFVHGGLIDHIKKRCLLYGIDTSHFKTDYGDNAKQGWISRERRSADNILLFYDEGSVRQRSAYLRRALTERGIVVECSGCGLGESWMGKELRLEVDHIDGNYLNCLIDNLRYLCPNCHSQTGTYKAKNK
jgi:hypothetical protein